MATINWEAVQAVTEVLGLLGVVVSMVFLVIGIRANTRALMRTEVRDMQANSTTAFYAVANDGELSEIVVRGLKSLDELNEVQYYRFTVAMLGYLTALEQAFVARQHNLYFDEDLIPLEANIYSLLGPAGAQQWWSTRRDHFTPNFQKIVDNILSEPDHPGKRLLMPSATA
jgi:hypothetical protein